MEFNLVMDARPPDAVITAGGELDLFTADQLHDRLQDAIEIGCLRVLIDVGGVSFVDASAMRVLSRFHTHLREADGHLRFIAWSPPFLRICEMTGLDTTFGLDNVRPMRVVS
jgi:anti-sigma B factor antagonist